MTKRMVLHVGAPATIVRIQDVENESFLLYYILRWGTDTKVYPGQYESANGEQ